MYMPWWGNKFFTWQQNKVDAYLIYMKLLALANLHFSYPFLNSYCQRIMLVVPLSPRPPSGRGLRFEPLFCNKEKGVMMSWSISMFPPILFSPHLLPNSQQEWREISMDVEFILIRSWFISTWRRLICEFVQ